MLVGGFTYVLQYVGSGNREAAVSEYLRLSSEDISAVMEKEACCYSNRGCGDSKDHGHDRLEVLRLAKQHLTQRNAMCDKKRTGKQMTGAGTGMLAT
ncbi:MAG: hypothetical protein ACTSPE_09280 [Candidatus Thorarchaeota archaeon]